MLVTGAQRMMDWATEKVLAPHAEHEDPSQHPDCMVCRAVSLVGSASGGPEAAPAEVPDPPRGITWIPIRDDRPEPPASH
jgi:hypothetical protein